MCHVKTRSLYPNVVFRVFILMEGEASLFSRFSCAIKKVCVLFNTVIDFDT